jgi:hypothetical protein
VPHEQSTRTARIPARKATAFIEIHGRVRAVDP